VTATYRLIHLTPDPFTGSRVALGAVVVDERGAVRVARVGHLPGACLGDRSVQVLAARIHARLDTIGQADRLPMAFGPYVSLASRAAVPAGVADPVAWVTELLNPALHAGGRAAKSNRATLGYQVFVAGGVARWVRKTFSPLVDGPAWLAPYAQGLDTVSHWVEGPTELLLMEPLVPDRRSFEHDLHKVALRFGGYQHAIRENPRGAELVAYLTAGGGPAARQRAEEVLGKFAHRVVDTDVAAQRARLLDRIGEVGRTLEL
jgi:hypothetical protein